MPEKMEFFLKKGNFVIKMNKIPEIEILSNKELKVLYRV